jgi:hypothetical protein
MGAIAQTNISANLASAMDASSPETQGVPSPTPSSSNTTSCNVATPHGANAASVGAVEGVVLVISCLCAVAWAPRERRKRTHLQAAYQTSSRGRAYKDDVQVRSGRR